MSNLTKKLRERGIPMRLIRSLYQPLHERAELVRKNKPIHGLAGIESPEGMEWLRKHGSGG